MTRRMTTCELREKDVIDLCGGARLGHACDFEFDVCDGKLCALIIGRETGFWGFGGEERYLIPWDKIECIGEDAVLIKIPEGELCGFEMGKKREKKR